MNLGAALVRGPEKDTRAVAAIALPTRAYAAVFAAAGAIPESYALSPRATNAEEHFRALSAMPAGTLVTFPLHNRVVTAELLGCEEMYGSPHLKINYDGVYYRRIDMTMNIHPVAAEARPGVRRRSVQPGDVFLQNFMPNLDERFSLTTKLDCVIVGPASVISGEIQDRIFAVEVAAKSADGGRRRRFVSGSLSLVLRCRRAQATSEPYRSDLIPSQSYRRPDLHPGTVPRLVIFDGAPGFLRWRDSWRQSSWLLILDRTQPATDLGVAELEREYSRRASDLLLFEADAIPAGVELVAYQYRVAP
jgi:hypothetical protein